MAALNNFQQRPLLPVMLVAWLGCLIGSQSWLPSWAALLMAGSSLVICRLVHQTRAKTYWLLLAVLLLYSALAGQAQRQHDWYLQTHPDRQVMVLTGKVLTNPIKLNSGYGWKFELYTPVVRHERKIKQPAGKLLIYLFNQQRPHLTAGQWIKIKGLFRRFDEPANPGQFDYAAYQAQQGVFGLLITYQHEDLIVLDQPPVDRRLVVIGQLQSAIKHQINLVFPKPVQPWILALLLGDRSRLDPVLRQQVNSSGLAHLLAISGLHLSIIFIAVAGALRMIRLPARAALLTALLSVAVLTALLHHQIAGWRALLMLACGLIVWFQIGPKEAWSAWALAGLVLLTVNPLTALLAGFQLSFAATAAIMLVIPVLPVIRSGVLRWIAHVSLLSLAIFIFTAPLTVYHFNALTPISIIANLAAIPLLALSLVLAWISVVLSWLWPDGVLWLGQLTQWWLILLEQLARLAAVVPAGHVFVASPHALLLIIWYGLWACPIFASITPVLQRTLLIGWSLGLLVAPLIKAATPQTTITAWALNKGEAFLIETCDRRILIDTGTEADFIYQIFPYLKHAGINHLDDILITHRDYDHSGGLQACLSLMPVRQVLTAGAWLWAKQPALTAIKRKDIMVTEMIRGQTRQLGSSVALHALWPVSPGVQSSNQTCLAVMITINGQRLLLTGDSPTEVENQWVNVQNCLLLKAGHHGDHKATGDILLQRASPQFILISAGRRNSYGLPDPRLLERVREQSAVVLNTFRQGAVRIMINHSGRMSWQSWE